ncbi:MAG: hypothetical protein QF383_05130 [Flavobacteriales bacterium]|nr:hypothetical protein [Flavobacteriales bacterium]
MLNKKLLLLVFGVLFAMDTFGQCAMCKAAVEANLEAGDDIGSGLNSGILYLMSMPYIAVFSFALFYYLQKRKKSIN